MWDVDTLKSIFDWGSVVLISLTVFTGAGALITGKIISDRQDEELAELNTRASEAQREAAGLEKQTAELSAQNLRLELAISPRRLSDRQVKAFASLKSFSDRVVEIKSYANDTEGLVLASQIFDSLSKSVPRIVDNRLTMQSAGSVSFGVLVEGSDKALVGELKKILSMDGALAIGSTADLRSKAGVSISAQFGVIQQGPVSATITVGMKPIK